MLDTAKSNHFHTKLSDCGKDAKSLLRIMYDLIGRKKSSKLPELGSLDEIAEAFSTHFDNKIQLIRTKLDQAASQMTISTQGTDPPSHHTHLSRFNVFDEASETEIRKNIMKSPTKSCSLDPFPTQLLKDHLDLLVPVITKLINCSLSSGIVPSKFKQALITPLIKKPSLDPNILKNYRPVFNLPFLWESRSYQVVWLSLIN